MRPDHPQPLFKSIMINAAITGGETTAAGELIRILINHPDVNLLAVASETAAGRRLTEIHRGLEGDTELRLVPSIPEDIMKKVNMVFLCGEPWQAEHFFGVISSNLSERDDDPVRIVDLTGKYRGSDTMMVYGLPEANRKVLVRGATMCAIPSAGAMAIGLSLFPLLKSAIIPQQIDATLETASTENFIPGSQSIAVSPDISTRFDPVAPAEYRPDAEYISREISGWIRSFYPAYSGEINIRIKRTTAARGMNATIDISVPASADQMCRLIDDAYSDHAFTYRVNHRPDTAEVANTNKCLLYVCDPTTPDDLGTASIGSIASPLQGETSLRIISVMDNLLKGGAGNAVHCMNLLFGLSEKTGLALKASAF